MGKRIAPVALRRDLPGMDPTLSAPMRTELAPAYLQMAVTLGLVVLSATLHARYRKRYFGIWAVAWGVYALRLAAIVLFLHTGAPHWLFWHQVTTGWTALALLWAALVFSQNLSWRPLYVAVALFPLAWSYTAIYLLDHFLWAAGPMVVFLSVTTAWTAWAFHGYARLVRSPAARLLAGVLSLWALHHLDYPLLRAQGAWNPWGYYLDIVFQIGMGAGILLLVLEDLDQGLRTLTELSSELQGSAKGGESLTEAVLRRALALRGVHGSALYLLEDGGEGSAAAGRFVHGAGIAALWPFEPPPESAARSAADVCRRGTPVVSSLPPGEGRSLWAYAYTAGIPIFRDDRAVGALVVVGEARDPFTVLDNRFLVAFGQQVGASLANERLQRSLERRTEELERLQARMVRQHEEERDRLWRELHDETAQVLAALNMQLGIVEEQGGAAIASALQRAKTLVGEGIKSIRSVTRNLRPVALDDLGLLPSLRALARDFEHRGTFEVTLSAPEALPALSADAEVALYRALQEALSNATLHAACHRVEARLTVAGGSVVLAIRDDGPGFAEDALTRLRSRGGLAGIRERIATLGGEFRIGNAPTGGAEVWVSLPTGERGGRGE